MVFKGKVAVWYWALVISSFVISAWVIWASWFDDERMPLRSLLLLTVSLLISFLSTLSFALRNKVILEADRLVICFGVVTKRLAYVDIVKIYRTNDITSSLAASLDRVALEKSRYEKVLVSLQDNDAFIAAVLEKAPSIQYVPRRW